ncbi:glycoside hydrolase family 3 C-terminal domain-containing protein [Paenibacillus andongensis]|uniref:glycoside hydrolase family 3 C-terminal domain-containing protein n=1 Tax=Paenibacillus andongensis TaxID=2975482 RepID=UPI0021BAF9E7|nr:glycoside hydrolase family 3 C-terminal domain-containing protein [Paenibacillus andongensis]
MEKELLKEIVLQMTLEEKAALTSGLDNWFTKGVDRLGVPKLHLADGPHGLRIEPKKSEDLNIFNSRPAICFPACCLIASSFDTKVAQAVGEGLGEECLAEGVDIILGPSLNTKRSPLCGRNFEYMSEDPLLTGEMGAAYINGVQSKGVGTSAKHFFANSQEYRRVTSSANADERTLRELYLTNFEIVVKKSQPWTVMAAYNKINGTYASEHNQYIEDMLYKEWGFTGFVVSDWGAVHNRIETAKGGTALTMPSDSNHDNKLVEAVRSGELDEKQLDKLCERIIEVTYRAKEVKLKKERDFEAALACAQQAAEQSIVLLKNEGVLPLPDKKKVAFIGKYAEAPRYQGGGSSHIKSYKVISALDAVRDIANVTYAQGYVDNEERTDEALQAEAIEAAKAADIAVVFAGLPESFESEGYDRIHMRMPACQNELIEAVAAVNPNTIVVLHNGAPVEMPWADKVKGIVEAYLGGDAVGAANVNILYGKVNPSGRLAETFPKELEDNPSYLFYTGENDIEEYREGVFVGYRYYETRKCDVLFPFGYGLSYTTFEYSNLKLSHSELDSETETLTISVDVSNTGNVEGKEVVQLYVAPHKGVIIRPAKEVKGFSKINLKPGETKAVTFVVDKRSFAYWNMEINGWHVESGKYDIVIGKNAHDELLKQTVTVNGVKLFIGKLTELSTIGDLISIPKGAAYWETIQPRFIEGSKKLGFAKDTDMEKADGTDSRANVLFSLPINTLCFVIPDYTNDELHTALEEINKDDWRTY